MGNMSHALHFHTASCEQRNEFTSKGPEHAILSISLNQNSLYLNVINYRNSLYFNALNNEILRMNMR